ncbi:MAG: hypothetical protein KKG47_11975 [Proteobacteria bacterium]|nr:hypothetical protein [Pseudomonadota bacterium]MBU1738425.1 hypothetical protein [Pseudomonadota bacterium]
MLHGFIRTIIATILLTVVFSGASQACVGRILYIGALENNADKVMAEMLVTLINERTGTNVKVRYFDNLDGLYKALKAHDENERVDIIVEDTADAMKIMNRERLPDLDQEYASAKNLYEKEMDIIWLNPFGFRNTKSENSPAVNAPIIRRDVLTNFPLLPRILNKLSGAINDQTFAEITDKVSSGEKPKNVAKDFLKARKFI